MKLSDIEKVEIIGPSGEVYEFSWSLDESESDTEYKLSIVYEDEDIPEGT